MCGIFGIINIKDPVPVAHETLEKMGRSIRHRGPDENGFFKHRNVGLGIQRLSIIDLSGGSQPIFNESKSVAVVYNGEIYNYLELRQDLEKRGHRFQTCSDTEVLVHAFEEWGEDCPPKLRGMFAFAVWDKNKKTLFLARDRLGQKPLYYFFDGGRLIFASEIKAILEPALGISRRINLPALSTYLTLGYVPAPATMFAEIFKLPPGHSLTLAGSACRIVKYWDLEFTAEPATDQAEHKEQLRARLEESIRLRLRSDVPLGALLSGGLDSSLIVGLMSRMLDHPVATFSVGFTEERLNELPYARLTAQHFSTNHHEIIVDSCGPDLLEKLVWHLDEPVADPAAVPTYLVAELARRDVKVVLTGEGGDELFAGYDHYRSNQNAQRSRLIPPWLSRRLLPAWAKGCNLLLGRQRYHARTIWHWSLPPGAQMVPWVAVFTDNELKNLFRPDLPNRPEYSSATAIFTQLYNSADVQDPIHRMMYIDIKAWLPDDLLMKVDKMSMAASLEARTPFLDHHLLEYTAGLPSGYKLKGSVSKFILKEIAREILPDKISTRPKHTFDVPIAKWLTGGLRELTFDLISCGIPAGEDLFDREYILGDMWHELETDKPGCARQFWSLLNLGLWAQKYDVRI